MLMYYPVMGALICSIWFNLRLISNIVNTIVSLVPRYPAGLTENGPRWVASRIGLKGCVSIGMK